MVYYISIEDDYERKTVIKKIKEIDNSSKIIIEQNISNKKENNAIIKSNLLICDNNEEKVKKLREYNKNIIVYIPKTKNTEKLEEIQKNYTYTIKNELNQTPSFHQHKPSRYKIIKVLSIILTAIIILTSLTFYIMHINKSSYKKSPVKENIKIKKETIKKDPKKAENIVFLGDSLTYQYDIDEFFSNTPHVNSGRNGYCIDDIQKSIDGFVYIYNPTKVVLLIGTNDLCIRDYNNEELVEEIRKIVKEIKKNRPYAKIYVESLYPVNKESSDEKIDVKMVDVRDNDRIQKINIILKRMCKEEKITYINMYDELIDEDGNLNVDYTKEGLHISHKGYEVITQKLKEVLELE